MEKGKPYAYASGKTSKTISSDTNISNFLQKTMVIDIQYL